MSTWVCVWDVGIEYVYLMHAGKYAGIFVLMWRTEQNIVFIPLWYYLETRSLTKPFLLLAKLTNQQALRILLSLPLLPEL